MTRFKICGLRDLDNALIAARAGASFLGMVFVPGVRRRIEVEEAARIAHGLRRALGDATPRLVGLFADQPLEEVNGVVRDCGLDMAQLCGAEPPEYWEAVAVPVIRQVRVRQDLPREEAVAQALAVVDRAAALGCLPLLDRHEPGRLGGTGRSFDWSLAEPIARRHRLLLAGGLTPANVHQAIARVRPWGVDVSSGVETEGHKDPDKIRAFAEAVRKADGTAR